MIAKCETIVNQATDPTESCSAAQLELRPNSGLSRRGHWKSDVDPPPDAVEHYRLQVRKYLEATGAKKGLIVFVTIGKIVSDSATGAA
jgi:hypothetical protein